MPLEVLVGGGAVAMQMLLVLPHVLGLSPEQAHHRN